MRRKRTDLLVDASRQLCEMKKECEELRRMVAHYKAVGMSGVGKGGMMKPQEKVSVRASFLNTN